MTFIFIFGLCVGSFLNCVIWRLEKEEKLSGRSYCPKCGHNLIWRDLVPVFSFLFLRGKCRYCSKKISWQYPVVEISTAVIFLLIYNFQFSIPNEIFNIQWVDLLFLFYIASTLIVIFVYDLRHYIIPDKILFPAIAISFIYRFLDFSNFKLISNATLRGVLVESSKFQISEEVFNYIFAALIASAFFLAIFLFSRGKWMGFGDVKLAILLGLILGFPNILIGLFLSFFFGAIIGMGLIIASKKGLKSEIPFAPFLITGTFAALFWGQTIAAWHESLILI